MVGWRASTVRRRNDMPVRRNIAESIPLESRPHGTLEIDLVCIEGDQMVILDSSFAKHILASNILTS